LIQVNPEFQTGFAIEPEDPLRLAILADIHANRQAFAACLDAARAKGAERIICLGDIVGYGADPEWTVDQVMGLAPCTVTVVRPPRRAGREQDGVDNTT
jgi:hypothetical protein